MAFADRLKELREENGLSMNEAAQLMDIAPSTYYHWEKDGTLPRTKQIEKIADAFGVTTIWLETGLGEKTPEAAQKKHEAHQAKLRDEKETAWNKEDEERLRDVEAVIRFIKEMNVPKERKRHIHRTMSAYRAELESVVLFGELK